MHIYYYICVLCDLYCKIPCYSEVIFMVQSKGHCYKFEFKCICVYIIYIFSFYTSYLFSSLYICFIVSASGPIQYFPVVIHSQNELWNVLESVIAMLWNSLYSWKQTFSEKQPAKMENNFFFWEKNGRCSISELNQS